jgi:hypothetical protein
VQCDASKAAGGADVYQIIDGKKNLISFYSFSFIETQIAWSIPKKECYVALKSLKKFTTFIDGRIVDLLLDSKICTQIATTSDMTDKDPLITSWVVEMKMLIPTFVVNEFLAGKIQQIVDLLEIKHITCVLYSHVAKIEIENKNVRVMLRKTLEDVMIIIN